MRNDTVPPMKNGMDFVVLGGGPAGYPAAFLAADFGYSVTLIDAAPGLGGTCLRCGCIPSKALLHAVHTIEAAQTAAAFGVEFAPPTLHLDELRAWKTSVVEKMTDGLNRLAAARKIRRITGHAEFAAPHQLHLSGADGETQTIDYSSLVLATGSAPVIPAGFPANHPDIWTSTDAVELPEIPPRLLVLGGGAIGLELGLLYAGLGSRVTLVEMMPTLLSGTDRELLIPLLKRLRTRFDGLWTGTCVTDIEAAESGGFFVTLTTAAESAPRREHYDKILVAAGRRPALASLHPERAGHSLTDKGFLQPVPSPAPPVPRMATVGDCASAPMLAHKATHEARRLVAQWAAADQRPGAETMNQEMTTARGTIPAVVYTNPEVATCGWNPAQAKAADIPHAIAKFHWAASGRAQAIGQPDGLTKWIYDPGTYQILGAGIVGYGAGELIGEAVLAIESGATLRDVARAIHPHPTLSETWLESASLPFHPTHHIPRGLP